MMMMMMMMIAVTCVFSRQLPGVFQALLTNYGDGGCLGDQCVCVCVCACVREESPARCMTESVDDYGVSQVTYVC